jgi:hypothetical protein
MVGGALVALFGAVLLSGLLTVKPDREPAPAMGASALPEASPTPSPLAVESDGPDLVGPVDWVTVEDDVAFKGGHTPDVPLDVALAPTGRAVIVGFDDARRKGNLRGGLTWWSPSGEEWHKSALPDDLGAQPRRVIATGDGFVAIGERHHAGDRSDPTASLWTSSDGIDWSAVTFEGAEFADVDSVDDTVAIVGTLHDVPTVWTSTTGGPWEASTIAEGRSASSPDQLALSADGMYVVRAGDTGAMYRSEDGRRFTPVDLPAGLRAGDEDRSVSALVAAADGFALVLGPVRGQSAGLTVSTWLSSDGREWRLGDPAPGLAIGHTQLGSQRAGVRTFGERTTLNAGARPSYLSFLQADGTWCEVSPPGEGFHDGAMAWNEAGDVLIVDFGEPPGETIIWRATDVRCGR